MTLRSSIRELKKLANELKKAQTSDERIAELEAQGYVYLPLGGSYGANDVNEWVYDYLAKMGYDLKMDPGQSYWTVVKKGQPLPSVPTEQEIEEDRVPSHWIAVFSPGSVGAKDMWDEYIRYLPNFNLTLEKFDEDGYDFFRIK